MTKVVVLGANGQLARNIIPFLLQNPDVALTLYGAPIDSRILTQAE